MLTARIICGTRDRSVESNDELIRAIVLLGESTESPSLLIVGGCLKTARGVDAVAIRMWSERGWPRVPMPAPWDEYRRRGMPVNRAGNDRNSMMAGVAKRLRCCGYTIYCDAFPGPKSRGTWDMYKKAESAGFKTSVYRLLLEGQS